MSEATLVEVPSPTRGDVGLRAIRSLVALFAFGVVSTSRGFFACFLRHGLLCRLSINRLV